MNIDNIFSADGILADKIEDYKPRPGQILMAKKWNEVLQASLVSNQSKGPLTLLAEGPTGVGKSFAYSIAPIIIAEQQRRKGNNDFKVVIATANIALQTQLIEKDIPFLVDNVLGFNSVDYSLLKGRNNYVCLMKLNDLDNQLKDDKGKHVFLSGEEQELLEWAKFKTDTGDKADLAFNPKAAWFKISVGTNECLGKNCDYVGQCYANAAIKKALRAHVIVTNYHVLLLAKTLLEAMNVLILDEAHNLADITRSALGWDLTELGLKRLGGKLNNLTPNSGNPLISATTTFFNDLNLYVQENFKKGESTRRIRDWADGPNLDITFIKNALEAGSTVAINSTSKKAMQVDKALVEALGKLTRLVESRPEWVVWVEKRYEKTPLIHCSPIDVSEVLPRNLYSRTDAMLLTSATMTTGARRNFNFLKRTLGIDHAKEVIVPSPFDLQKQGMLVLPTNIPSPKVTKPKDIELRYEMLADCALRMATKYDGSCLFLFTSWTVLKEIYRRISKTIPKHIHIYKQGDLPNTTALVNAFKAADNAVLMGVKSLWEGVDIPGDDLQGLLIDKLPFPMYKHPIHAAVTEYIESQGGNGFTDYNIPMATLALCQGMGRLIRRATDTGTVTITDDRLVTAKYRHHILNALPEFKRIEAPL